MLRCESGPTLRVLQEAFDYNPETGEVFWRERPLSHFESEEAWHRTNTMFSGRRAGTLDASNGYRYVSLFGKQHAEHRIVWWLLTGNPPEAQVDHINGMRADNRAVNLRAATVAENGRNQKRKRNNTSGVTGVRWRTDRNNWIARIKFEGVTYNLGVFEDFQEAVTARRIAEMKFGFAEGHGKELKD